MISVALGDIVPLIVQYRALAVDRQSIHAESMAAGRVGKRQYCDRRLYQSMSHPPVIGAHLIAFDMLPTVAYPLLRLACHNRAPALGTRHRQERATQCDSRREHDMSGELMRNSLIVKMSLLSHTRKLICTSMCGGGWKSCVYNREVDDAPLERGHMHPSHGVPVG
jgi:hypothetical protein